MSGLARRGFKGAYKNVLAVKQKGFNLPQWRSLRLVSDCAYPGHAQCRGGDTARWLRDNNSDRFGLDGRCRRGSSVTLNPIVCEPTSARQMLDL